MIIANLFNGVSAEKELAKRDATSPCCQPWKARTPSRVDWQMSQMLRGVIGSTIGKALPIPSVLYLLSVFPVTCFRI